jgi:catechol 2,3-dioxygenase-like lactoylglutathione lyase family enzyme
MSAVPPFPTGQLQQLGYVVEDLDEATETFSATLGVPRFAVWRNMGAGLTEKIYRGRAEDFQFSCAFGYCGDVMIELVQHESGDSVFKEWLESRGPGLHHVCYLMDSPEEYEKSVDRMAEMGYPVAMSARSGEARVSYADTVDRFGAFTELAYGPPEFLAAFDRIKRGEI